MTKFKLIGAAALLSGVIATPALAQQAVQEPGAQAFYQSLGVGSHNFSAPSYGAANALAATGNVNLSAAPSSACVQAPALSRRRPAGRLLVRLHAAHRWLASAGCRSCLRKGHDSLS